MEKKEQKKLRIAIQGGYGAFHEIAARQYFETDQIEIVPRRTFKDIFKGVPKFSVNRNLITDKINIIELLATHTKVFKSKGEIRRLMKDNGLSINQEKENNPDLLISSDYLINEKYIVIRQGKKKYSVLTII